jgi:hypothetical protein
LSPVTLDTNPTPDKLRNADSWRVLGIGYFTWWNMPRRAWYLILTELGIIIFLTFSLVMQYLYNPYFHLYVDSLGPILVPLASVAFGASSAAIAVRLYMGMRKIQITQDENQASVRRRNRGLRRRRKAPSPPSHHQDQPTTAPIVDWSKKVEFKLVQKPVPDTPSSPKPTTQPSPNKTPAPPGVRPEKEAKPPSKSASS